MKIFIPNLQESWVVDRFRDEFIENYKQFITNSIAECNIIWIISPWTWREIPKKFLNKKIVLCTIHHLEDSEIYGKGLKNFKKLDRYVNHYHTLSKKTSDELKLLTTKNIYVFPFWVNSKIFFEFNNKSIIKSKYGFQNSQYIVGSFQRDTEGKDLKSPKLIKGPDQLIEILKYYNKKYPNLTILLAGYRRQYIISELEKLNIKYIYFEQTDFTTLNELYNCLDLYIVSSRKEGGPQAILEAAITKTPIISTDVGVASEILDPNSIFNMQNYYSAKPNTNKAYKNVLKYTDENGFKFFLEMFRDIINN